MYIILIGFDVNVIVIVHIHVVLAAYKPGPGYMLFHGVRSGIFPSKQQQMHIELFK